MRIKDHERMFIKVGVKNYKDLGVLSDVELKDQLELSIVNQIVINQNGKFNVYSESEVVYFEIILPVKYLKKRKLLMPQSMRPTTARYLG